MDFFKDLKPVTKCVLFIVVGAIIISAMYFGIVDKEIVTTAVKSIK